MRGLVPSSPTPCIESNDKPPKISRTADPNTMVNQNATKFDDSTKNGIGGNNLSVCDLYTNRKDCRNSFTYYLSIDLRMVLCFISRTCLYLMSMMKKKSQGRRLVVVLLMCLVSGSDAYANELEKTDKLLDKINLEQSIAAVFNKVAYGSTTKRSIPDNSYPMTTLATPLLTTYRYSDGSDEWLRVDVKSPDDGNEREYDEEEPEEIPGAPGGSYGSDLEKDHALPTSAPAADILKNNNNRNYNNPNRYNNDRLKPDFNPSHAEEQVTENVYKTTTSYNVLRNLPPTKSIYIKDVPSYVPPSRAFFTPPLPPEYVNPFADKPTLRGTNSDSFANRRPIPPPSLMPNKDRIPFRPDLPPSKTINAERPLPEKPKSASGNNTAGSSHDGERKKTLNTPSQNANLDRLGEFYGLRNLNETNFEYEKGYIPTITRILSGSNGRHDDIPDILLKTVTANPHVQKHERKQEQKPEVKEPPKEEEQPPLPEPKEPDREPDSNSERPQDELSANERAVVAAENKNDPKPDTTTQTSDALNLPNVKEKPTNVTKANSNEIWLICWNVHVYLVVLIYIILAVFSIYKLIRYENDPHMFSKSYFLTVHLMLTVICVLRIFYLTYDPYNIGRSFNIFLYEFLHNFPLSLLATTFAVLILFLLKRTLNHLKVKTRPVFLVVFAAMHICMCFALSILETLGHFDRANLIVCRPVFVLLAWALGFSYIYLYKIIKNVLAKKSQNLSEMCTQNISYASHITIAVALLFVLLGFVQLYALFFIKIDKFDGEIKHHWILWGFELSVRVLEISIVTLLAVVVSLRMSQREKQTVGFPLFPCTTSDSSADNIFPNNCATNPNALNYSRNEMMMMDNIPAEPERPNLLKNAFQTDPFEKKSTLERYRNNTEPTDEVVSPANFERFERPKWGSERFGEIASGSLRQTPPVGQPEQQQTFERGTSQQNSSGSRKTYESAKYYTKPKYDLDYGNEDGGNVYSEPIDNRYLERNDFERRSKNSTNTSGRRSTGRARKNHARPHLGVQTLPVHDRTTHHANTGETMLVDDQGFVRFRHLQEPLEPHEKRKRYKKQNNDPNHYSDA